MTRVSRSSPFVQMGNRGATLARFICRISGRALSSSHCATPQESRRPGERAAQRPRPQTGNAFSCSSIQQSRCGQPPSYNRAKGCNAFRCQKKTIAPATEQERTGAGILQHGAPEDARRDAHSISHILIPWSCSNQNTRPTCTQPLSHIGATPQWYYEMRGCQRGGHRHRHFGPLVLCLSGKERETSPTRDKMRRMFRCKASLVSRLVRSPPSGGRPRCEVIRVC